MTLSQHDALCALLERAMGDQGHGIDPARVDFSRSMRENNFDSLTQVAIYSVYEEVTGNLPEFASISVAALLDHLDAAMLEPPKSGP